MPTNLLTHTDVTPMVMALCSGQRGSHSTANAIILQRGARLPHYHTCPYHAAGPSSLPPGEVRCGSHRALVGGQALPCAPRHAGYATSDDPAILILGRMGADGTIPRPLLPPAYTIIHDVYLVSSLLEGFAYAEATPRLPPPPT